MTRNLKALGLALVAAFAMSAVLATAAQAEQGEIKADVEGQGSADLTGEQVGLHEFVTGLGKITCATAQFDGTVTDGDTSLTLTPTYATCTFHPSFGPGTYTTTVNMNGCAYQFTGGNATPGDANHFDGITAALECPGSEGPIIKVYQSEVHDVGHTDNNIRCEFTVHPFGDKLHNTAENILTNPDHVFVESEVTSITTTRLKGTFLQCGAATQAATYFGDTTLKAYTHNSDPHTNQLGLTLTDIG